MQSLQRDALSCSPAPFPAPIPDAAPAPDISPDPPHTVNPPEEDLLALHAPPELLIHGSGSTFGLQP